MVSLRNHYHRPCRWYAQAPLGSFTNRAYRLIEFSFACVFCPTTADAVTNAHKAPSDEGAGFLRSKKTGGENISLLVSLPPSSPHGESTYKLWSDCPRQSFIERSAALCNTLVRGRLSAAAGLGIAKAFWNHWHCRWYSYTRKSTFAFANGDFK